MNNGTEQLFILNSVQTESSEISQKQVVIQDSNAPVNLDNVENFSNVCRTCATITQLVIPIFSGDGLVHHLADKILKHLPIDVSDTDLLPLVMCYQCVSTLLAWHELVECCLQADRALKAKLGVSTSTEDTRKESQPLALASGGTTEDDSQHKLNNITNFAQTADSQKSREPPRYSSPTLLCDYCNIAFSEDIFLKHLIVEHSELLFHCEQCDKYLNRREFITHMSLHAVQYTEPLHVRDRMHETIEDDVNQNNNTILSIAPPKAVHTAVTRNVQSLHATTTTTTPSNTTPITCNQNVNIVTTSYENINVTAQLTPDDNSNEDTKGTKNLNNAKFLFDNSKLDQNATVTTPSLNADDRASAAISRNNSADPRSPITQITIPITRHHVTNTYSPGRRNRALNAPVRQSENTNTNVAVGGNQNTNIITTITRSHDTDTVNAKEDMTASEHGKTVKHNQENEFSDHSDMEYGFGPLPESVFEAIEDSQSAEDASQVVDVKYLHDECTSETENNGSKHPQLKKSRTCPICSKVYKASSSYFYHIKHTHGKVKEHKCEICAKKFATKASLATHKTTHTGEYQFECTRCQKRFRTNASLYIHEQTHIGIKMFSCKQCNASFRWRTHLLRHMERHTADKNHVCSTCGRGFHIRCDLLRHARTHKAGEFTCTECDVKFAQLRYLKVHMARKHSKKSVKNETEHF